MRLLIDWVLEHLERNLNDNEIYPQCSTQSFISRTFILDAAHNPLKGELIHRRNESIDQCPFQFLEKCYEKYFKKISELFFRKMT